MNCTIFTEYAPNWICAGEQAGDAAQESWIEWNNATKGEDHRADQGDNGLGDKNSTGSCLER